MRALIFFVPGLAKTQGSKRPHFPKNRRGAILFDVKNNPIFTMVDSGDWSTGGLTQWKRAVGKAAMVAVTENGFGRIHKTIGVTVQLRFIFQRPRKMKDVVDHVMRPDLDKLDRACIDAMAGIVYDRDQQVCTKISEKDYQREGDPGVGVVVSITQRRKKGS